MGPKGREPMRTDVFVMIVAFACASVTAADAGEKPVLLKPGPGLDKVEGNWAVVIASTTSR